MDENGNEEKKHCVDHTYINVQSDHESVAYLGLYDGAGEIKSYLQTLHHICWSCLRAEGNFIRTSSQNLMTVKRGSVIRSVFSLPRPPYIVRQHYKRNVFCPSALLLISRI